MEIKKWAGGLLAGVLSAASMSGCASPGDPPGATVGDVWGKSYVSVAVTEGGTARPLVAGTRIRLSFEQEGRLGAHAGCNHLSGRASVDGGRLNVTDLGGTEMGCSQPLQSQDVWLTAFLGDRPGWQLHGDELVLRTGEVEVRMIDQRVAEPDRPVAGTKWIVDGLVDGATVGSVPQGVEAFLTIGPDGKLTGRTGCNSMGGQARVTPSTIAFGAVITTKMACAGDAGALEQSVLAVLQGEVRYSVEGTSLILEHPDGKGLVLRAGS